LFAKAIHSASPRSNNSFIRINCAAIPEQLLESELFGYEPGTFTGARKGGKKGKFELAHKGTIFLDEIGEMPISMQAKLLTVLQEKEIERLGSEHAPISLDVRIIAATNQNLNQKVQDGSFREDLYYRLKVIEVDVPPLRLRGNDINLLIDYFLKKLSERLELNVKSITPDARSILNQYKWPGNIRELEHTIEKAMLLASMENNKSVKSAYVDKLMTESSFGLTIESNNNSLDLKII
jgi:Transcriptional regulator containing PAS, AAA-type ATPase, and DNA-binding domains